MSVYDLYQSYLDQAKASPVMASPVVDPNYLLYLQQQQQGDDRFTNVVDPSQTNAGITSISDGFSQISDYLNTGGMIGGALFGPVGAIAGRGIGNLISNIQNPNTTMFGQPTQAYQTQLENLARQKRDMQQFTGGDGGGRGNIGSDGADYSGSAETGAKGGFGYGL